MARTKQGPVRISRISWRPKRRTVLVASLLLQNPTAAIEAVRPGGVTTRARSRRIAAAAAALPEEILVWEILARLLAKDVLRCRTICRSWRRITSTPGFLLAHHRRQPSVPLVTLYGADRNGGGSQIFKHGRPILGFDDYEDFELLLASCDGLLLISLSRGRFSICNPTTRQCAPLRGLTATVGRINIAALYLHHPTGEYRVLYWKERIGNHHKAAYYILTVRRGQLPRCIGAPSHIPDIEKVMLPWDGMTPTNLDPPVVLHDCLHWDPGCDAGILVFDTVVESFRTMHRPLDTPTRLFTRLCDMEGSIRFSCNADGWTLAKIWVLEDYEREVWSFKYHVKLPETFGYMAALRQHLVLSHKGDVLVYCPVTCSTLTILENC
ncbi:F-box protein At5g18160-like [Lolium perenne]|uniref:F-box protein At5g18160-like n=1 Tax=Lolium perenne TaxID=4522 RepID=UPI0021F55FF5|nr:F-box protein At5g18160-like [Lolium perenne]